MRQAFLSLLGLNAGGPDPAMRRPRPARMADIAAQYRRPPSFTDLLPWAEYLADHRAFLLEDGRSVGAVLELEPVGCEARPASFFQELHQGVFGVLTNVVELDPSPWIVQWYLQDEDDLSATRQAVHDYIDEPIRRTTLSTTWLGILDEHLHRLTRSGGVFDDTVVTDGRWGAKRRRVRLVLYRRLKREEQALEATLEQLGDQIERLIAALAAAGVQTTIADGAAVYDWLLRWFNPAPPACDGDAKRLREIAPYPGDTHLPYGRDFAELTTLSIPVSEPHDGIWRFDGLPHTCISAQGLRRVPDIGALTAERQVGDKVYAVFDRMPPGTRMALTLVFRPQDLLRHHVAAVKKASIGDGAEAVLARENTAAVEIEMARGDRLLPTYLNVYLRAPSEVALRRQVNQVESLLLQNGIQTIGREADLLACDAWVRNLPMNYDPTLDRSNRRSRLAFASHLARLLPVYGRSRGTGHPGLLFWNRGGEPLVFDPLNRHDRKQNGHMLILGPTGAGKSATLVYLLLQAIAVWRPRVYLIEAGNSLGLLCSYLETQGLSVHQVFMQPGVDVSLPPFAGALSLLDRPLSGEDLEVLVEDSDIDLAETQADHGQGSEPEDERRDLLGEMEIAARIMITGGDAREDAKMSRADRMVIRRAILEAARTVRDRNGDQALTEDVAEALRQAGQDPSLDSRRRERAVDMADALLLFCSGLAGHFFNRPGQRWPAVDVTHLEMGILAREGYEDQLTVAYTALMNHINSVVEARQHEARPTLVITDEGHIITTNPLLAPYVIKITKMWRKFGAWYWIATQNLEDFPDASRRMLNMLEWWLCLVMPKEEVDQIARFRALSEEQRGLLLSARKESGKYTEGVVLTPTLKALFRNVPPAIALALAQTEKEEKAARAAIMREHGCTEVEAALKIAEQIDRQRTGEAGA